MFLLGCEKATIEFPTKVVFEQVSLGVDEGARIGIVGRNGDGKSTLLHLLSGALACDEGRVVRTRGVQVGVLEQSDALKNDATVKEAVVGDAEEYVWAGDPKIRELRSGLLFDIDWDAKIATLSGGQRRRVDIARLLAGQWDVLMLDEPTNHLDIRTITWLAAHLKTRWKQGCGALLVVTHDRWFLDEVCLDMWEVHDRRVEPFEGGFSAYIEQRVERDRIAALTEQKRQNTLRRELAWLSRGARARATKPKFHVAAAQALIADVPELRNTLELKRMACARIGKIVVEMTGATLRYPGGIAPVLRDIDWNIGPGDRIGIVGANGAGKTTLLKLIQGTLSPTSGRVKIGQTVRFAVLSQNLDNLIPLERDRVREVVGRYTRRTMLDGKEMTPGQLLEHLGFSAADLNEPVGDLSGGQRRRLALMLILLDEPNVLILDEPGNDLDIDMLAALEDLLDGWPGTVILVTHDRYLMERVTDDQYAIFDGALRHLPGGIDEYLEITYAAADSIAPSQYSAKRVAPASGCAVGAGACESSEKSAKLSGGEVRELKKTIASCERKLETARAKLAALRDDMSAARADDYVTLSDLQAKIDELEAQIATIEDVWLEATEALER